MPIGTKQEIAEQLTAKSRDTLTRFHEAIVLYAAGAISLSTTLLGFLLLSYAVMLRTTYFLLPNIWYLFLSWIGFMIALLAALYSRRRDSDFLFYFGLSTLSDDGLRNLVSVKNPTILTNALQDRQDKLRRSLKFLRLLQGTAELAFPLALVSLLVFTIFTLLSILK